ncbi:hypothetical protein [Streptomyces meridianus]|uniref:Integral membrane protein n=1 Tax=Streptomyces meridianus TaxID=2938945 RepID=A0ABT0XA14_9ACTN|nr:hypothetical protein [Streptomyces meridianus]MCM2579135.1 hypothetical protein [Streptomyces meridianus]
MATATSGKGPVRRSRTRRMGESAFGLVLVGRNVLITAIAMLLMTGGVWTSWGTAQHAMLTKGREQGTMAVERCRQQVCSGRFTPRDASRPGRQVVMARAVNPAKGQRFPVSVKPGTDEVVRTGLPGVLYAWIPFGGSLLLVALVIAGGLRMRRTAWVVALLGAALLGGAYATL